MVCSKYKRNNSACYLDALIRLFLEIAHVTCKPLCVCKAGTRIKTMVISDKTRKKLWAKSRNRFSICKTELFSNKEKAEDLNIGEECHIISSKSKGSRNKKGKTEIYLKNNLWKRTTKYHLGFVRI